MKPQEINHYFSSCQPSEAEKQELAKLFNAAGWNLNDPSYGGLWNLLGGLMRAEWKLQWMNDGRPAQGHATNVRMKHRKWPGRMQGALWVGVFASGLGFAANGTKNGPLREFRDRWGIAPDHCVNGRGQVDPAGYNGVYLGDSLRRLLDRMKKEMCSGSGGPR